METPEKEQPKVENAPVDSSVDNPLNNGEIMDKDPTTGQFLPGHKLAEGRPPGKKNFDTLFEQAVKKIAEMPDMPKGEDPEVIIVKQFIRQAMAGEFKFGKDILDRRYGAAQQTIDATVNMPPIIFEPAVKAKQEEKIEKE